MIPVTAKLSLPRRPDGMEQVILQRLFLFILNSLFSRSFPSSMMHVMHDAPHHDCSRLEPLLCHEK